jgi:hypothetical protein
MQQHIIDAKQYIEQHKQKYIGQHIIDAKQYIEQHSSLIRKNADRAPSFDIYSGICLTTEEKAGKFLMSS